MDNSMQLGRILRERRTEKGMSLREFSEYLSISHAYLDKLEKGCDPRSGRPIAPTIDILNKISAGLELPLETLLGECGYVPEPPNASRLELTTLAAEFVSAVADADEVVLNGEPVAGDRLESAINVLLAYSDSILVSRTK